MKYMQTGGFQQQPLTRLTLGLTLLLLAGFWVTNLALYTTRMTLDPASVALYYRGSEEVFVPARSAQSLLEVTHMHLPMFAVILLLLTHLLIFAPLRNGAKIAFILAAFLSALLSEAAGWMTRFWHPGFAWLKVTMFLVFQGTLAYLIAGLAWFLTRADGPGAPRGGQPRDGHGPHPDLGRH